MMQDYSVSQSIDLRGTIRTAMPAETIRRAESVCKLVGITRVANITGLDSVGIPVWVAIRPLSRSLSVSQGKGLTHELAKAAALMESIEVYHAEQPAPAGPTAPLSAYRFDSRFLSVADIPMHSGADACLSTKFRWAVAHGIFSQEEQFIPADLFNLDLCHYDPNRTPIVRSSNGLSSGNSFEEAVLHGVCELIERDQYAFWTVTCHLQQHFRSIRVDLESIDDADVRRLISQTEKAGLDCYVWYSSTNIAVPVFEAVVVDRRRNTLYPIRASGHGCHPIKRIALCRALTEALQSRLTFISGSRDDCRWRSYRDDLPVSTLKNEKWLREIDSQETALSYASIIGYSGSCNIESMLRWVVECLNEAGLPEPVVVNLSRAGIGIPVVYVCGPGLEHMGSVDKYLPGKRMMNLVETLTLS